MARGGTFVCDGGGGAYCVVVGVWVLSVGVEADLRGRFAAVHWRDAFGVFGIDGAQVLFAGRVSLSDKAAVFDYVDVLCVFDGGVDWGEVFVAGVHIVAWENCRGVGGVVGAQGEYV